MAHSRHKNSQKIRIGQVGLGYLGQLHVRALRQIPEAALVGVFDIERAKRVDLALSLDLRTFDSLESLFKEAQAVLVAVPTRQHFEVVEGALSSGLAVFVEKPMTATVEEADRLLELVRENHSLLQVGHIERFNPAVLALGNENMTPRYIASDRLTSFRGRGSDVDVILDLMIHDLDLILSFVRSSVSRIDASGLSVITPQIDLANARIQFENGCVANATASRVSQTSLRKMNIYQPESYFSLDFLQRRAEKIEVSGNPKESNLGDGSEFQSAAQALPSDSVVTCNLPGGEEDSMQAELKAFLNSVRTGEQPVVDVEAGRRVLVLATEIAKIVAGNPGS